MLFSNCSYRVDCHRSVVNGTGKVHFNAGIEPIMTCAVLGGLEKMWFFVLIETPFIGLMA